MSEYTTVYLRHKNMPLLKKKEHPSHEECQSQSKEDLMKVIREIDEYNKQVAKSLGCKLFYLTDFVKAGDTPNEAWEKAKGQYGRVADAVKIIDPRKN